MSSPVRGATTPNGSESCSSIVGRSTGSGANSQRKDGKAKVELGLAKGKTSYDKRETIKERDADREMERAMANRRRGT
jgi:hypothetical protein